MKKLACLAFDVALAAAYRLGRVPYIGDGAIRVERWLIANRPASMEHDENG